MALTDRLRQRLADRGSPARQAILERGSFVEEALDLDRRRQLPVTWRDSSTAAACRDRDAEELRAAAVVAQRRLAAARVPGRQWGAALLAASVAKRALAWTPAEAGLLVESAAAATGLGSDGVLLRLPLAALERLDDDGRSEVPLELLAALRERVERSRELQPAVRARALRRIDALLPMPSGPARLPRSLLVEGDAWGVAVRRHLGPAPDASLVRLLEHLATLAQVRPSRRWMSTVEDLLAGDGAHELVRTLLTTLLDVPATPVRSWGPAEDDVTEQVLLVGPNADTARGAVWAAAAIDEPWVGELLAESAEHCGRGWRGGGDMREGKVANSAAAALATLGAPAVPALIRLRETVRNRTFRATVARALEDAASAAGLTSSQLLERSVPDFGLDAAGRLRRSLGTHIAEVALEGDKALLRVTDAQGRRRSGVPSAVREAHGDELAALRSLTRSITKALGVERRRLEGLLAASRAWTVAEWAPLYRDHPLTGHLARRLLWEIDTGDARRVGTVAEDGFRDRTGATWTAPPEALVRLWHPLQATTDEVAAWRDALVARELQQPFKQAFREIYRLTPAELDTVDHSNRFAAHIVRFPQLSALLRAREWAGTHLGHWDGGYEGQAVREIGDDGWRAQLYYDLVDTDDDELDVTLASTDQVRFSQRADRDWVGRRLDEVPELVFSEAMRDVDLFVAVSSIAADPAWVDRGERTYADHWREVSFGELTAAGQTRHDALARLVPRLAVADRLELGERFLTVRGDLRTYKIHLGSANILMEPDDAYLCIVPERRPRGPAVFLPFTDDGGVLSTIISKALLLADDRAITDRSILAQIRRR